MGNTGMPCCEKLSLGSMAVLSGELLSGKAAKTRAKRTRTSGEAYFLFVNGRYHFNSLCHHR